VPEPLIGRDGELHRIATFLDGLAAHGGGACLLVGTAGVGKTVLLDAAAQMARDRGALVLRAAGVQFEAHISYSGLNQLLMPWSTGFGRLQANYRDALNAALGIGEGPPPPQLTLVNAALTLLTEFAPDRPTLLVIDDLPWLDRASAVLLSSVARRLSGSQVGLLGATRPGAAGFFERSGLPEVDLAPLDESAAAELLATRFPALAPQVRRWLLRESQGNPLALMELPANLSSSQRASASALPMVLPLSGRLQTLFTDRIANLPEAVRAILLKAALDGSGDLNVLLAPEGTSHHLDDLAAAEDAQLIRLDVTASRLSFRHPLMRSAVVEHSTAEQRRTAHRELAARMPDQPERRAWHLAEASTGPDEEVADLLQQAAQRTLQRGDATGAVSAMTRAASLSAGRREQSRRLAEAALLVANTTGELKGALQLLEQAQSLDLALEQSPHAATAISYILINGDGDLNTAYRLLLGAIESGDHGYDGSDDGLIHALHTLLLICFWLGRADLWPPFYAALERLRPRVPELLRLESLLFPDPARAMAEHRAQFVELIKNIDDEHEPTRITRINTTAAYVDLLSVTRVSAWRLVQSGRQGGAVRSSTGGLMYMCLDNFFTGRWDEAEELADEGLGLCQTHGYEFIAWYFFYVKALLAAVQGDDEAAQHWADEHTRVTEVRGAHGAAQWAEHARTLAAIAREDYEAAYQHASALSPAGEFAPFSPHAFWVPMDLVEASVRTGRHEEAHAHVAAMRRAELFAVSPRLTLMLAASAALADQTTNALALFDQALALPDVIRWPLEHARIRLMYGERLRRARRTPEARTQLNAALATFQQLGAATWADRAQRELRAAGETGPRLAEVGALTALTAQELQIARLAAEGLTNRQIGERLLLSHRTVGAHLYRLYPKLGVTTRAALHEALGARKPEHPA
jgi:DNA-binding CsgD family transcriptional regulator